MEKCRELVFAVAGENGKAKNMAKVDSHIKEAKKNTTHTSRATLAVL